MNFNSSTKLAEEGDDRHNARKDFKIKFWKEK